MDSNIAISLRNVGKTFQVKDKQHNTIRDKVFSLFSKQNNRLIKAVRPINLKIKRGEFFGIIGTNGSGKSTLIQLMSGAYVPDSGGLVNINGKHIRLALGMGFNKELTARENIYLNASILGLTLKKIGVVFNDIIKFAELESFIDTKIKYFSSGMLSRLKFAIAIHVDADILFLDEVFVVGDAGFKEKAKKAFDNILTKNKTIVMVSHSMANLRLYCNRILLLDKGKKVKLGKPNNIISFYNKHYVFPKRKLKHGRKK